jgi:hypothetical protein
VNSRQIQLALAGLLVAVVGMGFYAYRLMHRNVPDPATQSRSIAPPVSGPQASALLLLASDKRDGLQRRNVEAALPQDPSLRAREIIRLLLAAYTAEGSEHPLPRSADVREVFFVSDDLVVLDMNAAFADAYPSNPRAEQLTLNSMVQTLAANFPNIRRVKILVEGREREKLAGNTDLHTVLEVKPGSPR